MKAIQENDGKLYSPIDCPVFSIKLIRFFIVGLLALFSWNAKSQVKAFPKASPYPYLLFTPKEATSQKKIPLIIFLHGRSLSGKNLKKLYQYGPIYAMKKGLKIPCYVLEPQTPMGSSWNPQKVNTLLNKILKTYPKIDTNRIYVVGMSLGGFGTMEYCGKYWYRVAAGVAMCGGGQVKDAYHLSQIPFWIMHGKKDQAVPFDRSMQMAEAITESNNFHRLFFDEHPTFGHGEYARAFNKPEFYSWLMQHQKQDSSLYILADHYIDIFPKSPCIHFTIPNEPGLYLSASSEEIPLDDQTIFQEDTAILEEKTLVDSQPITTQLQKPVTRKPSYYVVKKGDNLSSIAHKTGVPIKVLKKSNGLTDKSILKLGMKLKLQ